MNVLAPALALLMSSWSGSPARVALDTETAAQDAALLGLGMRRLAADLEFVRLLIYYGSPESRAQDEALEHSAWNPAHPESSWGGGRYLELGGRARRILSLDPTFSYVAQYAAGALAFNLGRSEEALALLRSALDHDPGNKDYQRYIGAIGFSRNGDMRGAVELLEPTLADPDCPTMIKSMAAFMYMRLNDRPHALALYRAIAATSNDQGYRALARRKLAELEVRR